MVLQQPFTSSELGRTILPTQNIALVVDDDLNISSAYGRVLESLGYRVFEANSLAQAISQVASIRPNIVLLDMALPDGSGLDLLKKHAVRHEDSPRFIIITGDSRQDIAIDCLRAKADDFLTKPITLEQLRGSIDKLEKDPRPANDQTYQTDANVKAKSHSISAFPDTVALIGESAAAKKLRTAVNDCANSSYHAIVLGDIGSEKAMLTSSIHCQSKRSGRFVLIHGSEITNQNQLNLLLTEAVNGTLAIDDVASMSLALQRLLATHFRKIALTNRTTASSSRTNRPARVIATMHCDPHNMFDQTMLDPDLYYWLAQFVIAVPSLKNRKEDIIPVANAITKALNSSHQTIKAFNQQSMSLLENYHWPGNLRELNNVIRQCYASSQQLIHVDKKLLADDSRAAIEEQQCLNAFVGKTFWETEKILLFASLDSVGGDKTAAAKMLGISLKTLYNRIKAYS